MLFCILLIFIPRMQVYDPSETRLLVTHASPGREGVLAQLALVLKADLTISAGLHFRYGVSYNEFSVQHDQENFRAKLAQARAGFNEVWDTVKQQVEQVIECVDFFLATDKRMQLNIVSARIKKSCCKTPWASLAGSR
jgi:hypothetical protein